MQRQCNLNNHSTKFDLNNHSTPLNTRALSFVLENIKTNVEVEDMPPSNNKANEAESKRKMESTNSWIPMKVCKGLVHSTNKHFSLCKRLGGIHTMYCMCNCNGGRHPRSPVVQLCLVRKTATYSVLTLCRSFT